MTSDALTRSGAPETADAALNLYLRAVWAKLASGALIAALAAWTVALVPFLRASILIEARETSIGLSLAGVALAACPLIIWAAARVLARGPNLINPLWFWLFAVSAGVAANTLALLFLRDSVASVFALAAVGFGAIHLAHRMVRQTPSWTAALIFVAVALGGEWIINSVLAGSGPTIGLKLAAIGCFALLIALRGGTLPRIYETLTRPKPKAGVTYAAMHLIALAEARAGQPVGTINEEARS